MCELRIGARPAHLEAVDVGIEETEGENVTAAVAVAGVTIPAVHFVDGASVRVGVGHAAFDEKRETKLPSDECQNGLTSKRFPEGTRINREPKEIPASTRSTRMAVVDGGWRQEIGQGRSAFRGLVLSLPPEFSQETEP